jgi:hypothetical protein
MTTFTIHQKSGDKTLEYEFWSGQRLRSSRECPLSIDTETTMIEDERQVPRLALAVASDGKRTVIIHPNRLAEFLAIHKAGFFVGHNITFDFWVINEYLACCGDEPARRILWDVCDQGRLFDTQILDMLMQLATGKFRKVGEGSASRDAEDTKIYPGNLAEVVTDYTSYRISKEDPYRTRFGDLIGVNEQDWDHFDQGFFEYAARDALTTYRLYPALADAAYKIMLEYGFDGKATRYDIRPDAIEKFGYLSETIQVKASIVLASMFRRGVRVDEAKARLLESKYRNEMAEIIGTLEREYPEVLTYAKKDGKLKLTPKSQTPSLGNDKLKSMLLKIVEEIKAQGHTVEVPLSNGKKKDVSRGVTEWHQYADLHPFLRLWERMSKLSKALAFLAKINAPVMHGEYSLMTRTGRTSCKAPRSENIPGLNLQNVQHEPEFRELFIPGSGRRLFIGDFAAAELRTLAAVCKAKFGFSKLGDVITQGTDPHAFTAASIQGINLDDFLKLKAAEPKRFKESRQAAKALNFGIPGGLGVDRLRQYAKNNYGVTLTEADAKAFKEMLIKKVYPELNDGDGYLADESMAALACNLGVKEREAWEVFDRQGKRNSWAARGVSNVIQGTSTASDHYQASVWAGLNKLTRTSPNLDEEIAESIASELGGRKLHERLYHQSVATLTGRIRAGVGYTDGKNTPFQSLAADGAKLALWKLLYTGLHPYAFVHDETLVEVDASRAEEDAKKIVAIKVQSMEEVMGHGIPAACDWTLSDCWTKP